MSPGGQWGRWGAWRAVDECSALCGGGEIRRRRERQCDNPPPEEGGEDCHGNHTEIMVVPCNVHKCPGKSCCTPGCDLCLVSGVTRVAGGGCLGGRNTAFNEALRSEGRKNPRDCPSPVIVLCLAPVVISRLYFLQVVVKLEISSPTPTTTNATTAATTAWPDLRCVTTGRRGIKGHTPVVTSSNSELPPWYARHPPSPSCHVSIQCLLSSLLL